MSDRTIPRPAHVPPVGAPAPATRLNPYCRSLGQHLRNFPAGSPGPRSDLPLQAPPLARPPRGIAGAVPK